MLHLYASYTGASGWSAAQQFGEQIAQYSQAGFQIELVLTYRPRDGGSTADVANYVGFVRGALQAFDRNSHFVSLQVTNEVNVTDAPNAADGYYVGASDALVSGVLVAREQLRSDGAQQVKLGFNCASSSDPGETTFWRSLAVRGGTEFARALDWVGLDAYPGTWGPAIAASLPLGTADSIRGALQKLRHHYMPLAGLRSRIALHISESGYPTGLGRTDQMQVQAMTAAVHAVNAVRRLYNITDYRWFDLRDADSTSSSFEDHYGLMSDSYRPKPAFGTYHRLIAQLGTPEAGLDAARAGRFSRLSALRRRRHAS